MQVPAPSQPRVAVRFGLFEVDLHSGELRKQGVKVKLQDQPFQILVALLQHAGDVVSREELRRQLWPMDTFVDFEHGLNVAVKRLRDALGDSAEKPVFIETIARRGYRFIAPVHGIPSATAVQTGGVPVRSQSTVKRLRIAVVLFSLLLIPVVAWKILRHPQRRSSELTESKLTTNSSENSVSSAAVSPDGKLLAYSDTAGVYLKHIRTGETHQLQTSGDLSTRLHVDDWYPDGSHLLVTRDQPGERPALWAISVFGGSPRQLTDNGDAGSVSPDGAHIAFHRVENGQEEWVMRSDGTDAVRVADDKRSAFLQPTWSPDGNRIAYIKFAFAYNGSLGMGSIEINEWKKARVETLLSDSQLGLALNWLADGRLIYSRWNSDHRQDAGLWAVSPESDKIASPPKRIVGGHGWVSQITGSDDGRVVTYLRGNFVPSVYIATLADGGVRVLSKRRLTFDENENDVFAWTLDGKSVLFSSDRNGTMEIFKQGADQSIPETLVTSHEQLLQPKLTPGGLEILYISVPKETSSETQSSLFAMPIVGGAPHLILKDVNIWNVQCARLPSTLCMYSNGRGETFGFDPSKGKSSEPPQIDPLCNWGLSPDGSMRAIVLPAPKGTIRFRSATTGKSHDVQVKGGNELGSLDWAPDGKSLYIAGRNPGGESVLLNVTLDGRASVLLRSSNSEILAGIPSPNGRYLAIPEAQGSSNAWAIENF
jgi:Tol biopolymer transport system component/DNA-binding winged helix-turn-helix (wHTH) protein